MEAFIHGIPKAELHIHIEGALEPELMMELAAKNHITLPWAAVKDIRQSYDFKDLQSFLDLYYQGAQVLLDADDFYRLTRLYLQKAAEQNVRHSEIFFDPQTHTARGVKFETVVTGIYQALMEAEREQTLSAKLIMCFLRDRSVNEAMATLEQARDFKDMIVGVGLDSCELGFPPQDFGPVFDRARHWGFKTVAHAGEEGPPDYIWQALKRLKADRIDHGIRCLEDAALVDYLVTHQIPLTVCPLSNVKLKVFEQMKHHNVLQMLDAGICVTVNSDDPAYFGGYIEENLLALHRAQGLNRDQVYRLARNAFKASFLDRTQKDVYLSELEGFVS